ncbi:hypothetical protein LWI29_030133 [Acer saccharum]|uniref:Uncharacterized protein n=1 Tax=Acer saccharum TaxID=4024 RepID=A0AA39SVD5_ACESA|nr:hypothetical protein LWI29_030133 [Acer saccharum]
MEEENGQGRMMVRPEQQKYLWFPLGHHRRWRPEDSDFSSGSRASFASPFMANGGSESSIYGLGPMEEERASFNAGGCTPPSTMPNPALVSPEDQSVLEEVSDVGISPPYAGG